MIIDYVSTICDHFTVLEVANALMVLSLCNSIEITVLGRNLFSVFFKLKH